MSSGNTINSRSKVLHYTLIYHNLRGNFMVRLRGNSSTERGHGSRPRLISLPSALTHQRERKRERYRSRKSSSTDVAAILRVYIYMYVYGGVARGRQDNYRFEMVYVVGTLIEPRRLNNSHRRDSSSGFFSIVETARRAMENREKKLLFPFTLPPQ